MRCALCANTWDAGIGWDSDESEGAEFAEDVFREGKWWRLKQRILADALRFAKVAVLLLICSSGYTPPSPLERGRG
jgi:hypothetical protein